MQTQIELMIHGVKVIITETREFTDYRIKNSGHISNYSVESYRKAEAITDTLKLMADLSYSDCLSVKSRHRGVSNNILSDVVRSYGNVLTIYED